jgi:hypothetical protein
MAVDTSSDKWTIAGVSPATRKVARAAARRENMTLGEWIERAVGRAAESRAEKTAHRPIADHRPKRRYF